jgi:hypothetical protein
VDFGLKVFAKIFRNDAGRNELTEVGDGQFGQVGKDGGQGRGAVAYQSQSNIVGMGPLGMLSDGLNDGGRNLFAGKSFQDLRFGEMRIVENDGEGLRMAFREKSSGDAGGPATGQRDFLAKRELGQAGRELIFRVALQIGRDAGCERELDEIHEIEIAQQAQGNQAGRMRVKRESALDAIALQEMLASRNLFEKFRAQILTLKEKAKSRVVESRIVQESAEDFERRIVNQSGELLAGGGAGTILRSVGHGWALLPSLAAAA